MIKKILVVTLVLILFSVFGFGSENIKKKNDEEYKKFSAEILSLYKSKKYLETAKLLEKNFDRFPEQTPKIAFNATVSYIKANKLNNAIIILERALKKGIFFNNNFMRHSKHFAPLKELMIYNKILSLNEQNRSEAQKMSKAKYEIVLPEKYDKKNKYPLFIALHGGSSNIKNFKPRWTSEILKQEYIISYVQSSQIVSTSGYHWGDLKITEKDLKYLYNEIRSKYLIDEKNILIGGFSSGGYGSLFSAFKQIFPIKGYVTLCPVIPEEVSASDIQKMKNIRLSGVIITSDVDPRIKTQKEFSDLLNKEGLRNQLMITPNIGHWFPKNLDKKIDEAIKYIADK